MKIGTWAGVTAAALLGAVTIGDKNSTLLTPQARAQAVVADNKATTGTLEKMIADSEKIFTGVCIKVEKIKKDPKAEFAVVELTFKITDGLKGVKGSELKFKLPDNPNNPKLNIFDEKQKSILFLKTPTNGITPSLGLYGQQERVDVYRKDGKMGEFIYYRHGARGEEFKYEEFIKTVKDTIVKQNNKK